MSSKHSWCKPLKTGLNKKWYDFALEKLSEFDVEIIDDVPSIDYKKIKAEKIKVWQE